MTNDAIQDVIGKRPALFKPPYGATNNFVLYSAQENNLKIVLWSIDTLDWSQKESVHIKENVLNNVRNGDIILMHSDGDKTETEKALPLIIEGLINKGFQIVTLDILINEAAYR
jgi:peptidoglycan-N-acetylglucosamine deacetylase